MPAKVEIVEGGVVANMGGCWASNNDIQSCYCKLHEIHLNGNCEAIDPEYLAHLTETPTPDSPRCKAVIRKKTVRLEDWEDYGQVVAVMPGTDIPSDVLEVKRQIILYDYWAMTVNGFADAIGGEEATRIPRPCMIENGTAWGLKLLEKYHIGKEGGVARLVTLLSQIVNLEGDVIVSRNRVDKTIGTCPFFWSSKEVCALFDSFVEGSYSSLDECLKFTHHKIDCPSLLLASGYSRHK